jgi:hypothetical protein
MSGSLTTAFALWLATQIPGLKVIGQKHANPGFAYPECLVTELSNTSDAIGLPLNGYKNYNAQHEVVSKGKNFNDESVFRLRLSAPDDPTTRTPGTTRVMALRETIKDTIKRSALKTRSLTFTDSEVTPAAVFSIRTARVTGIQDIPPDDGQEPFIYRCALTVTLKYATAVERNVDSIFKTIQVEEVPYGQEGQG